MEMRPRGRQVLQVPQVRVVQRERQALQVQAVQRGRQVPQAQAVQRG